MVNNADRLRVYFSYAIRMSRADNLWLCNALLSSHDGKLVKDRKFVFTHQDSEAHTVLQIVRNFQDTITTRDIFKIRRATLLPCSPPRSTPNLSSVMRRSSKRNTHLKDYVL